MSEINNQRTIAMLCHLSFLLTYFIPFGNLIAPLVVWQIYKDKSPYISHHAKEALNFQICISILVIISFSLIAIGIGMPLLALVGITNVVLGIIAALAANKGDQYYYPYILRLVK